MDNGKNFHLFFFLIVNTLWYADASLLKKQLSEKTTSSDNYFPMTGVKQTAVRTQKQSVLQVADIDDEYIITGQATCMYLRQPVYISKVFYLFFSHCHDFSSTLV